MVQQITRHNTDLPHSLGFSGGNMIFIEWIFDLQQVAVLVGTTDLLCVVSKNNKTVNFVPKTDNTVLISEQSQTYLL